MFEEKFNNHIKKFNLAHPYLDKFEKLLKDSDDGFLECSVKIKDGKIFANRFNIYYTDRTQHKKNIKKIFDFFKSLHKDFDYTILKEVFSVLKLKSLYNLIAGIDLREDTNSRAKIYLEIIDDADMVNLVLKYDKQIEKFVFSNSISLCIDLYFDGKTRLKSYVPFQKKHLRNIALRKRLKKLILPDAFKLLNFCEAFNISYKKDLLLHLTPKDKKKFALQINNDTFQDLWTKDLILSERLIIILSEKEIESNNISNLNIYY